MSEAGDHESAIEQLRLAVRDFPKARWPLGLELSKTGRHDEAVRELSAFIDAEPRAEDQRAARMLRASISMDLGRIDEASAEFRRLVEWFPSDPVPRERLAGILLAQGNAEAAAHYGELVRRDSKNLSWQLQFGRALGSNRRFDEAAAAYRQALSIDPRAVAAHAGLAAALLESGHISEASTRAAAALALAPGDAALHNILGAARATQGHLEEAIAHFRQAIAINPNYAEARRNLAQAEGQLEAMRSIRSAQGP
jgi:tetratricopeptide (TPR) repeat protein